MTITIKTKKMKLTITTKHGNEPAETTSVTMKTYKEALAAKQAYVTAYKSLDNKAELDTPWSITLPTFQCYVYFGIEA